MNGQFTRHSDQLLHQFLPHPCPALVCPDQVVRAGRRSAPPAHHRHPHSQPPSPPLRSLHTSRSALGLGCERRAPLVW